MTPDTAPPQPSRSAVTCRHCLQPIFYSTAWWEHVDGTVACDPHQPTWPPRGTNAEPDPGTSD